MIFQKIKKFLGIKNKNERKEIIITVEPLETRVALMEDGVLQEFSIERDSERNVSGNIYKGRVHNDEPALKALFVDIGLEKNSFLHYWDAIPGASENSAIERFDRRGRASQHPRRIQSNDIPKMYPAHSDIIVQVTKGPIGTKGARVTTNVSLAGRYTVLTPYTDQCGISRKIEDPNERKRLREIINSINLPEGMGIIVRTNGENMKARYFVRDIAMLLQQWERIENNIKTQKSPALVFEEPDIVERTVRDFLTDDIDQIIVDDKEKGEHIRELIAGISKRSANKITVYQDQVPLFEKYGINRQIENAFRRQVWLKSGAYIVIDETEALVAIDVNTGRNKGGNEQEHTIVNTNLEAAEEIARQLRIRNIGGIVILDFIDMKSKKDQQSVVNHLRDCLTRDKAKTHVLSISQLGLVEMTRQRVQESLINSTYTECACCKGKGVVKSPETMSVELQRTIASILGKNKELHELRIHIHPKVMDRLRSEDEELLVQTERKYNCRFTFRSDFALSMEEIKVFNTQTDEEIKLQTT